MSPREKIIKILQGSKPDSVPWFGDLDYLATAQTARGIRSADFIHSAEYIKWHRDLNVGFYLQGFYPFKPVYDFKEKIWNEGNNKFRELFTPKGNLRECWTYVNESFCEAPVEYLMKDEKDLAAIRYVYENTHWEADYKFAKIRKEQIGDQGIMMGYTPKSPFMQLVALEAGISVVTLTEVTANEEFKETLNVMSKCFEKAAQITIESPVDAVFVPENLSSEVVGPNYFNKYVRDYHEKWVKKIRDKGKYSFVHFDGTLRGLLREESSTGFTVIEAMTPKPVGDLRVDEWRQFSGASETIFWGGIPGSYFTPLIDDVEFDRHVIETLEVMKKEPKYVLGVADQVPPDGLESRVMRVAELVELYGKY
jgi:uroporphyrinogen-III decarboxylase